MKRMESEALIKQLTAVLSFILVVSKTLLTSRSGEMARGNDQGRYTEGGETG
jgi:hypothetical protein